MKSFICVDKCTYGKPPRLYNPGDALLADLEKAPRHFKAGSVAAPVAAAADDAGKTLAEAGAGTAANAAALLAAKTAPEACTVGDLAVKLGVDPSVIKEASGKAKVTQKLTSDEVSAVMAAVAKAAPVAAAADDAGKTLAEAGAGTAEE